MQYHTYRRDPKSKHKLFLPQFLAEFQCFCSSNTLKHRTPTNWNTVFDILLDALSTIPTHFTFQNAPGWATSVVDMAAADDLQSTCGSLDCLQLKAVVVSAFCIIFGLDIATTNLRTYHVRWGNENFC